MSTKFTARLNSAVDIIDDGHDRLWRAYSRCLFSPLVIDQSYEWIKLMESDGTLLIWRGIRGGEGRTPLDDVGLLVGVVLQSEESTSQAKADPMGKASIASVSTGVWVDKDKSKRRRLDVVHVLFVLPKGSQQAQKSAFTTAQRNASNAASLVTNAHTLELPRGISAQAISEALVEKIEDILGI